MSLPQPIEPADAADYDAAAVAELSASLGADGAVEIVAAMVEDFATQRRSIEDALAMADAATLQREVHTLKGMLRLLNASALAQDFGACEKALAGGAGTAAFAAPMPAWLARYGCLLARVQATVTAGS